MTEHGDSRWAGRNGAKAAVRARVWTKLIEADLNVGPAFDRIPNFVGADVAAKRGSANSTPGGARESSSAIPIRPKFLSACARSMTASSCSRPFPI